MGYRKISYYLNERGMRTIEGNRWKNTTVYSVLKRYKQRQERLELRDQRYGVVRSKMWLEYRREENEGKNMKYMLLVMITMGSPVIGEDSKTFEMRIPQENLEECMKSAKTFRFSLPVISMDTRCEPRKSDEDPEIRGV